MVAPDIPVFSGGEPLRAVAAVVERLHGLRLGGRQVRQGDRGQGLPCRVYGGDKRLLLKRVGNEQVSTGLQLPQGDAHTDTVIRDLIIVQMEQFSFPHACENSNL